MRTDKIDKSYVLMIVLFLIGCIVSWQLYFKVYQQEDTISIHLFPKTIGGWTAQDLHITNDEKALLETDNVFARRYTNPQGESVQLFIVYSQYNRKVSHPPEICYTGSGAMIMSSAPKVVSLSDGKKVNVKRFFVEFHNADQIFYYWFKVGDAFTTSYWKQQGLIALKSFLGQPASSALIRISSYVEKDGEEGADWRIKKFVQLIFPLLHQYLP